MLGNLNAVMFMLENSRKIAIALVPCFFLTAAAATQEDSDEATWPLEEAITALADREGDHARALSIIEQAANEGDSKAQNALCSAYRFSIGVSKDKVAAFGWCLASGEQGELEALFSMGEMCGASEQVAGKPLALGWYRKAAEQGHAGAQYALGLAYDRGKLGLTADQGIAVEWYQKAAEQGLAISEIRLGEKLVEGREVPQDHQEAFRLFCKAAEAGEKSEITLSRSARNGPYDGLRHLAGQGYAAAAEKIHAAAEQGDAEAQRNLGQMYAYGQGKKQDFAMAFEWIRKAAATDIISAITGLRELASLGHPPALAWIRELAELGDTEAQYELGDMHASGEGVARDDSKAAEWFYRAAEQGNRLARIRLYADARNRNANARERLSAFAEQGDAEAQWNLGWSNVTGDKPAAVKWFRKAAEQGHAGAQSKLADLLEDSTADLAEAIEWLRRAAEHGDQGAQFNLAVSYEYGIRGFPKDKAAAAEWWRKSAEQGDALSQWSLGTIYAMGHGVSKDLVQGYAWLRAAGEQDSIPLVNFNELAYWLGVDPEPEAILEEFEKRAARMLGPDKFAEAETLSKAYVERYVYPYQCGLQTDVD